MKSGKGYTKNLLTAAVLVGLAATMPMNCAFAAPPTGGETGGIDAGGVGISKNSYSYTITNGDYYNAYGNQDPQIYNDGRTVTGSWNAGNGDITMTGGTLSIMYYTGESDALTTGILKATGGEIDVYRSRDTLTLGEGSSIAKDVKLELGGTINLSGGELYISDNDLINGTINATSGKLVFALDTEYVNSNCNITGADIEVADGKTLEIWDDLKTTGSLINGTDSKITSGDDNAYTLQANSGSNAGTITTKQFTIGDGTSKGTFENNGTITSDIIISKGSTLQTAADKITDSDGITNDGTLELTGGTLTSAVNSSEGATTGHTDISGTVSLGAKVSQLINVLSTGDLTSENLEHNRVVINEGGKASFTNATFEGNNNTINDGGAIYNQGSLTIADSTFSNNKARNYGGAIYNKGVYGDLTKAVLNINNSSFDGNSAETTGAIYNEYGTLTVTDTSFTNNKADRISGAISNNRGLTTVIAKTKDVEFSGNTNKSSSNPNIDIDNSGTLNLNATKDMTISLAGGIISGSSGNTLNINGSLEGDDTSYTGLVQIGEKLKNQNVNVKAGELHLSGSSTTTEGVTTYTATDTKDTTINVASGAVLNVIDNKTTSYNNVSFADGAVIKTDIWVMKGSDEYSIGTDIFNITNDSDNRTVKYALGNLFGSQEDIEGITNGEYAKTIFYNSDIGETHVKVDASEGSIIDGGKTFTLKNGVNENQIILVVQKGQSSVEEAIKDAISSTDPVTYNMSANETYGFENVEDRTVHSTDFIINGKNEDGTYSLTAENENIEGIVVGSETDRDAKLTINDATINGFKKGAAVTNYGTLVIKDATFGGGNKIAINNMAGGTLTSDPTTYNARVTNAGTATFSGDTFENITSTGLNGGAIYNEGTLTVQKEVDGGTTYTPSFTGNSAQLGGAIYNTATANISDAAFSSNQAAENGGAIFNSGTLALTDSSFTNNTAGNLGGAIYSTGSVTINAVNSAVSFSGNTANGQANDIYMSGTSDTAVTLALNSASDTNKISLAGGIDGQYYDVNVNYATDSSGTVELGSVAGANRVTIEKGTVTTTGLSADRLNITSGTLTSSGDITVNQGTNSGTIGGTGTFNIDNTTDGTTIYNNSGLIKNKISISSKGYLTTSGANASTADASTSGITNTVDNAGFLQVSGGNIIADVTGDGILAARNVAIASGVKVNQRSLATMGTLDSSGDITVKQGANSGTIKGTGTFTLNDGGATPSGEFTNSGSFTQKALSIVSGIFRTNASDLHLTNDISNEGTVKLTGGTLNKNITGTNGEVDITTGATVTNSAQITGNKIAIDGKLITAADKVSATSGIENAGTLELTSATLGTAVTGDGHTDIKAGTATVSNNTSIAQAVNVLTGTFENNATTGSITGLTTISEGAFVDNAGTLADVTNNSNGSTTVNGLVNSGTISGVLTNAGTASNTASGSVVGNVINTGILTTAADKIATGTSSAITNDGTIVLTGGTLAKDINKVSTGNGIVEITGDVASGTANIKDNSVKLTSGTFDVTAKADDDGNIDLSNGNTGSKLIANGGTLSVQDGKRGEIKLGDVNTDSKALNVAIDADFTGTTTAEGIEGTADKIVSSSVSTAVNKILISDIKITTDPVATLFKAQIADTNSAGAVDVSATTLTGLSAGAGSVLLSYDNSTGYLTGAHSDLTNAITSTIPSKLYGMTGNESIDGPLNLVGNSLSITGNGNTITSATAGNNGIGVASGQTLSIANATMDSFGSAIGSGSGSTVNLTDVTFTNSTDTNIDNEGTLNLAGTNTLDKGIVNESGATLSNAGTLKGSTVDNEGSIINKAGADIQSGIQNNSTGTVDNAGTISGKITNVAGGSVANFGNITGGIDNAGTLGNAGTISTGDVTNSASGSIVNLADGNISSKVDNSGSINNSGKISGAVTNKADGKIANNTGAEISGTIDNAGTVDNVGKISGKITNKENASVANFAGGNITGGIDNSGTLGNAGTISTGAVTNSASGSITNLANGVISSAVDNAGDIGNYGTISGAIDNTGDIDNYNAISGKITNKSGGEIANFASITGGIDNSGTLGNAGTISNGAVTNKAGGSIVNLANGTISSKVDNSSIINNSGKISGAVTNKTDGYIANNTTAEISGAIENAGKVDNAGTISGAIANAASGTIENLADANITGNIVNAGSVGNAGTISGTVNNTAGATVNNVGSITGLITNAAEDTTLGIVAGVVNSTAAGIQGGIANNGTLNLNDGGDSDTYGNLGSAVTGSGTTNIAGTISTNSNNITQGTVNVGKDSTGTNTDAVLTNNSTITADNVNITSSGVVKSAADKIIAANGIDNDGELDLNCGNLASDITSTNNTGVTNIAGTVSTNGHDIEQKTVNIGSDGTATPVTAALTNEANDSIIADAINVTTDGTLNQNGTINATDITNNGGTLDINAGSTTVATNAITNNAGTTNINEAVTTANINANGGNTNLNTGARTSTSSLIGTADVNIGAGGNANVTTSATDFSVDNAVNGTDSSSNLSLATLNPTTPETAAGFGTNFTLNSSIANATIELASGQLTLPNESNLSGVSLAIGSGATLNTMDGSSTTYNTPISFADNAQVKTDVDALAKTSDSFANITSEGATTYLTDINLANLDKIVYKNTDIDLKGSTGLNNVKVTSELQGKKFQAMTPIRVMEATISEDGLLNIHTSSGGNDYKSFNPAALAGPVAAQIGGYLTQLNSYDEAFRNMDMYMLMTKKERQALKHRNQIASLEGRNVAFDPTMRAEEHAGGWFRPYATFEKVGLHNGPKVENTAYGSFFGGESELKDLGHGWDGMWGAYVGYNGSHQNYDGVSIYQNGGTLGLVGMAYKGNFFIGTTINAGASAGEASTYFGQDDFTMIMAGIAAKTGYNWELAEGKFIIQPSVQLSYSFVDTLNYTNAAGVRISSDPLNAIAIEPGVKFIGNLKNGWQPYAGVSVVINAMDKANFNANDITLPSMSVNPYVKYGVGVRKTWGERLTGFFQTFLTNGGRNGVGLQAGFRWTIGKNPKKTGDEKLKKSLNKTPELKKTEIILNNHKVQ